MAVTYGIVALHDFTLHVDIAGTGTLERATCEVVSAGGEETPVRSSFTGSSVLCLPDGLVPAGVHTQLQVTLHLLGAGLDDEQELVVTVEPLDASDPNPGNNTVTELFWMSGSGMTPTASCQAGRPGSGLSSVVLASMVLLVVARPLRRAQRRASARRRTHRNVG